MRLPAPSPCLSGLLSRLASRCAALLLAPMLMAPGTQAANDPMAECLLRRMETAVTTTTVGELREACVTELAGEQPLLPPAAEVAETPVPITDGDGEPVSLAKARILRERETEWSPYVLNPHKQNYILPYTVVDKQNPIYNITEDEPLDDAEAKYQLNVKVPLYDGDMLVENDALHFGFTIKSFWQVYNDDLSAPFRETNYNPELFYSAPLEDFKPWGGDTLIRFGIEHESNGRSQLLSRSWNRVYTQLFYARDNYVLSLKPWYRLPEKNKNDPLEAHGDDNPDINKYMGNFELRGAIEINKFEFSTMVRNNLRGNNKGALELGASFPLYGRLRGYVQYFNGYGESLIDYNHDMERIGVGVLLTDLL